MVLVGLDGALGGIGAMKVRGNKLKINSLVVHQFFEASRALIVQHLGEWAETAVTQMGVQGGVGADEFMLAARLEGFGEDGITVMVVEDHEVFAAPTGSDRETPRLVGGNFSSDLNGFDEDAVGASAGFLEGRSLRRGEGGGLGGPNVLSVLAKVAL